MQIIIDETLQEKLDEEALQKLQSYLKLHKKADLLESVNFELISENPLTESNLDNFELTLSDKKLKITATSEAKLINGFNWMIVQMAKKDLPEGRITVQAKQEERGLLLDCGRKYFSKDNILAVIDIMQTNNMNVLQMHFSENEGFRIESETFPQIVSKEHLTKNEVKEIIQYANERGISIIPEIDAPGHLRQLLTQFPEWKLTEDELFSHLDFGALDITNPEAIAAIRKLYTEYFELFDNSEYFHIGADEFVAFEHFDEYPKLLSYAKDRWGEDYSAVDVYIDYINQIADFVSEAGFVPRVWNDGLFRLDQDYKIPLTDTLWITYWTKWHKDMAPVEVFLNKGYNLLNFNDNFFYFVLGENAGYTYPTGDKISNEWQSHIFSGGQEADSEQIKGSYFSIWSDKPEALTADEVIEKIKDPLQAKMEKEWEIVDRLEITNEE